MTFKTEQEQFWAGEFGNDYIARNTPDKWVVNNIAMFAKVFARTGLVSSVIEYGANIGLNLRAIKTLLPGAHLAAVEINREAANELEKLGIPEVYCKSILDFYAPRQYELVVIKGVMIHINPEFLGDVYKLLYNSSARFICIGEYYNPAPVEVSYRGHKERLFKRDFAGEMLDRYPDLRLLDYGFEYRRSVFPNDDITWFLLEKTASQA